MRVYTYMYVYRTTGGSKQPVYVPALGYTYQTKEYEYVPDT